MNGKKLADGTTCLTVVEFRRLVELAQTGYARYQKESRNHGVRIPEKYVGVMAKARRAVKKQTARRAPAKW